MKDERGVGAGCAADLRFLYGLSVTMPGGIKGNPRRRPRVALAAAMLLMLAALMLLAPTAVWAHNGPPFPIMVDQPVGPCVISVWTDPNVGTGTFFVIVNAGPTASVPDDLKVEIGVQPVSGRLAEAVYAADLEHPSGQTQYKALIPFDAQEFWRIRIILQSAQGSGETTATVEVTPPGYGRWDMLIYLAPFLAVGFLWLAAVVRKRRAAGNV
jgi:hypothetical protein